MRNILDYIEQMKDMYEGPRTMAQGSRTGFKDGNGVYDEKELLGKRVRELMDEGYEFGEAVKQAMKEGYAEGGRIGFDNGGDVKSKFYAPGAAETKAKKATKKLKDFVENFKLQNKGRLPTIMEVVNGAKSSTFTIRKYLTEGVDFVKTSLSDVGKAGGEAGAETKKTGVTKLDQKAYKKLQDTRIKGISYKISTGQGGSVSVQMIIQDPIVAEEFFGSKDGKVQKTTSRPGNAKGLDELIELTDRVAVSDVYEKNVLPFQTEEYKRYIKRKKAAMYREKDPFRIYEKLSDYKSEIFPEGMSKKIQIQHGDAKFTTQTLSRWGLIEDWANIAPEVEKAERLRNNALKIAMSTLDNPNSSVAAKKAAAEKYNSIAKGLRGHLKGTPGHGLVNFQLLDVDDKGNYKKLKDISFNPKKGLVASNEDLSKITKERANELIAEGKKKLDSVAAKLKKIKKYKPVIQSRLNSGIPIDDIFQRIAADLNLPMEQVKNIAGKTLRGFGKLAVVADPMFAAMDASEAFGKGASGKDTAEYVTKRFFEGLANLPALAMGGAGWLKDKAQGKDAKFEMPYEATFARDALKRDLDRTPENVKQRRIAEIEFDNTILPNMTMVDDMDIPASKKEIEIAKDTFLKNKLGKNYQVTHPQDVEKEKKIDPFASIFDPIPKMEFAGGGMAGIRRPSAIPPESGPQSQGLASLKKYGSYY